MLNHKGPRLLLTGIPTAGKSYLAKKLEQDFDFVRVSLDDIRNDLIHDPRYSDAISFYFNQKDEEKYFTQNTPDQLWHNLVEQSEKIWPAIEEKINEYADLEKAVVFESVNLLPHLVNVKYPNWPLVIIISDSFETIFERNKKEPRWGKTEELQKLESQYFFNVERPRYKSEGEKYGYKIFQTPEEALDYCVRVDKAKIFN